MKKGWKILPFEKCIEKVAYPEKVQRKNFLASGDYPVISQEKDFINGYWDNSDVLFKIAKPVVIFGDHTQVLKYVDFDFVLGADGVKILQPISEINPKYLFYFLSSVEIKSLGYARHYRLLTEISVSYPPLPEQKRIVSLLDECFAALAQVHANAGRNLVNAREVFESELNVIFGNGKDWEQKTLRDISIEFARGKSKNRPRNEPKLYGGKYPFVQTGDIRNSNHYITEYTQTYNEVGLAQSRLWKKGTICITIAANIAETGILDFDACFPDSVIGLFVNPKIADVGFTEYMLQYFKKRLQAKGKGSAQDNLNMGKLENEYFPIPPLGEQSAIVARLDGLARETSRLEAVYRQKVEDVEELRKTILKSIFQT